MTLDDIIYHFRLLAGDTVANPYMWSTELVETYAALAEDEACSRKPLLTSSTNDELCKIAVEANTSSYAKHTKVRQVYKASLSDVTGITGLQLTDVTELNLIEPSWNTLTGIPKYLVIEDSIVTLVPPPDKEGFIQLVVSHVPLVSMIDKQEPTIDGTHHYMLIFYMLHLAYSKRDADTENLRKAAEFEDIFSTHFGPRPDANAIKSVRQVRETNRYSGWI